VPLRTYLLFRSSDLGEDAHERAHELEETDCGSALPSSIVRAIRHWLSPSRSSSATPLPANH
jgi:hypothetical protein